MWFDNDATQVLGIRYPIIQAGMAGGVTTAELVAEVSEAGGLGTLGAGYMQPEKLEKQIQMIKKKTTAPFAVNVFVPGTYVKDEKLLEQMKQYLGTLPVTQNEHISFSEDRFPSFTEQMEVILKEKVPVVSFTFGVLPDRWMRRCKENGIQTIGTATSLWEAKELEKSGVDLICAQGSEAGGHRGSFAKKGEASSTALMALLPPLADHLRIPIFAAGGIMDGRGVAAALALGAQGVQMGTAFLRSKESGAAPAYKKALRTGGRPTTMTKAVTGKWARGLCNELIDKLEKAPFSVPDYPLQNNLTQGLRRIAAQKENAEWMSLWAGQGYEQGRDIPAGELLKQIVKETTAVLERIGS